MLLLVETQRTLTLSTADPPHGLLLFFTSTPAASSTSSLIPKVATFRAAIAQGYCAALLYRDGDNWQDIEGLQMEGAIQQLEAGKESARILTAYVAKFPTVKHFFIPAELDFSRFCELFHSQLYAFTPSFSL